VRYLRDAGRACVVVRFPDEGQVTLPLDWTDRRPAPPPLALRGKIAKLHPLALRELCARIADLGVKEASTEASRKLDMASEGISVESSREHARLDLRDALGRNPARAAGTPRKRDPQGRGQRRRRRSGGRR